MNSTANCLDLIFGRVGVLDFKTSDKPGIAARRIDRIPPARDLLRVLFIQNRIEDRLIGSRGGNASQPDSAMSSNSRNPTDGCPGSGGGGSEQPPLVGYQPNNTVRDMVVVGNTAYIGGSFTALTSATGGTTVTRNHVAAIDMTTGNVLPWNPNVTGTV